LIDFGRHFGDILKGLASKIKHLAPHGRTKTLQKRIREATMLFIDFGSILGATLVIFLRF